MGILNNTGTFFMNRFFGSKDPKKNVSTKIVSVGLNRVRQDIQSWRSAVTEAETSYFQQRSKMQILFADTVLNGHVFSCMEKRKKLTLQRDFEIMVNGKESEDLETIFKSKWFADLISYMLDAQFYGYSLVSLGDCIDSNFPEMTLIKRENVSPDRLNVAAFVGMLSGDQFMEEPFATWHIYADTPSENGHSRCGYGLLYKVAMYEIICRNLIGANATAAELFGMPLRHGKTDKTEEEEREAFANSLAAMGSAGWVVTDLMDEIELIQNSTGSTGYQIYENLEKRCEAKISKLILGHADALDSVPGKLGNDGRDSPAQEALKEIKVSDGNVIENLINNQIIPKLRKIGFGIPEGAVFCYSNNDEKEEQRARVDASNKITAEIAQIMTSGGLKMDPKYFEERTGIPTTEAEIPEPDPKTFNKNVQNKINALYK
jgi:phage gp29-like protein